MTENPSAPIRVLLVDDQELLRAGFAMILEVEPQIVVVGEARDGDEALAQVEALHPDVVLMDVRMPGTDGIEATSRITSHHPDTRVVMLTTFDDDDHVFAALRAGAKGFLLKNCPPEDLVAAIERAAAGYGLLAPELLKRVLGAAGPPAPAVADPRIDSLTERELDVLTALARGLSNAEIAADMFVSAATVKTHVSSVLAKLGARDRVQAVIIAHEVGLTRPTS